MARGPFQGTYQSGIIPTVVHAPDALVYINGEVELLGCQSCRRRFDFNKYITSIQVDLSVDSPGGGSASINMAIPRHAIDDFYFDGNPLVTPMMEVEIYAKGFYLVEGMPQYYPIFWGLITETTPNYSSGENTFTIQCSDILKWWELCRMNVNAAFTAPSGQQGRSIFGNVFFGTNPYDVIWTLAQASFGDVVIGSGSLISLYKEQTQKATFTTALTDIMVYWEQRFRRIRSNLVMYGVNGVAVRGSTLNAKMPKVGRKHEHFASSEVSRANGGADGSQMIFDPASPSVTAFRTQFSNAGNVNFWQSEYQTKLEIANLAKEAIGFELYMDPSGDIVFKPPFFNLDVLSNKPVSWLQDIDIIDCSWPESESEVVTQLTLQGSYGGNVEYNLPEEVTPFTSVTDYHLLRKYGWRPETYNSEFLGDVQTMFYHGMDILDRKNSRRHKGSATIPLRPELRLGFPVYVPHKDEVWYVSGISHNIQFGGRATTQLTLTSRRGKFYAPASIGHLKHTGFSKGAVQNPGGSAVKYSSKTISQSGRFELKILNGSSLPGNSEVQPGQQDPNEPIILTHPKTGRKLGYPNAVMVYTRPFKPPTEKLKATAGVKSGPSKSPYSDPKERKKLETKGAEIGEELARFAADKLDELQAKYFNNRYQYGLNSAGVYTYAYDSKKVIGEIILIPTANIDVRQEGGDQTKFFQGSTAMIRPVSDERGFEVIGHFRYGRGLALRDGRLVLSDGGSNQAATIDVQQALSGSLKAVLAAQTQGLTTINTGHADPADTLSRLSPDGTDLQTAAVLNPETKEPEFVNGGLNDSGTNFVEARPLGSPEEKGFAESVEASQLSRALTLAELRVKDPSVTDLDPNCACLLGRPELNFINAGYQVKTIRPVAPASGLFESTTPGSDVVAGDAETAASIQNAAAANRPVPLKLAQGQNVLQRVDEFLYKLYSALDTPHQAQERELRGGSNTNDPTTDRFEGEVQQFGDLSPPFSAPNRYALGAGNTIGQTESNLRGLREAWSNFGANLRSGSRRTELSQQIATKQAEIARLTKEKQGLEIELHDGGATVVGRTSAEDRLAKVNADITRLQQEIAGLQSELNKIPPTQRT
jgi:hypothetical protein